MLFLVAVKVIRWPHNALCTGILKSIFRSWTKLWLTLLLHTNARITCIRLSLVQKQRCMAKGNYPCFDLLVHSFPNCINVWIPFICLNIILLILFWQPEKRKVALDEVWLRAEYRRWVVLFIPRFDKYRSLNKVFFFPGTQVRRMFAEMEKKLPRLSIATVALVHLLVPPNALKSNALLVGIMVVSFVYPIELLG